MADGVEAVWQDVEQKAADQLGGRQGHGLAPGFADGAGAIILPAKRDPVPVHGDEAAVGNGDAVGVAGEICEISATPAPQRPAVRAA